MRETPVNYRWMRYAREESSGTMILPEYAHLRTWHRKCPVCMTPGEPMVDDCFHCFGVGRVSQLGWYKGMIIHYDMLIDELSADLREWLDEAEEYGYDRNNIPDIIKPTGMLEAEAILAFFQARREEIKNDMYLDGFWGE